MAAIAWTDVDDRQRGIRLGRWLSEGRSLRMTFGDASAGGAAMEVCDLLTDAEGAWSGLRLTVPPGGAATSLASAIPAVHWDEREIQDMFGLPFAGHPDPRPLLLPDTYDGPPPLRPSARPLARPAWTAHALDGHGIVQLPVGPVHAGIIESGHFRFSTMGETVLQLDLRLSWNHRGVEPHLVGRTAAEAATILERVCGSCSASHQEAFAQTVESLGALPASGPTARRRMLILEYERIVNHLNDLGQMASGVGLSVMAEQALSLKESALRLAEEAFGHRYLFGTIRPGYAVPLAVGPARMAQRLRTLAGAAEAWVGRLFSSVVFRDRLADAGRVSAADARALGAGGPVARASGLGLDVRVDVPYGAYRGRPLEVFVRTAGDALARAEVRRLELVQSFALAQAALDEGVVDASPPFALWPDATGHGDAAAVVESPRGATAHVLRLRGGRIARYHMRPASFANWPLIMVAARDNPIGDFPLINKSFELCYACADR